MRARSGFVSNSSSCSFIITNTSSDQKTLVDFVKENEHLIAAYLRRYNWHDEDDPPITLENMIKSAEQIGTTFPPGIGKKCVFGDEDGTMVGQVYDYMLRDGGMSKSFTWDFHKMLR